jgi:LuxR family maltose regulon positive regulatory protein
MGFEYQIRAEYYLETGDFEKAELYAYKAAYRARTTDQMSGIICANLVLMRIGNAPHFKERIRKERLFVQCY